MKMDIPGAEDGFYVVFRFLEVCPSGDGFQRGRIIALQTRLELYPSRGGLCQQAERPAVKQVRRHLKVKDAG
jgi:hypothetical protein